MIPTLICKNSKFSAYAENWYPDWIDFQYVKFDDDDHFSVSDIFLYVLSKKSILVFWFYLINLTVFYSTYRDLKQRLDTLLAEIFLVFLIDFDRETWNFKRHKQAFLKHLALDNNCCISRDDGKIKLKLSYHKSFAFLQPYLWCRYSFEDNRKYSFWGSR